MPYYLLELSVHIDCPGCEKKIRKALRKVEGVEEVEVDMERQKVTVTGWAEKEKVLKAVRKTGKRAEPWSYGPGDYSMYDYYNHTAPAEAAPGVWTGYYASQQHPAEAAPGVWTGYYASQQHPAEAAPGVWNGYYASQQHPASPGYYQRRYDDLQRQQYWHGGGYTVVPDGRPSAFSDDKPHACSVM